jgi:hypothetical protein
MGSAGDDRHAGSDRENLNKDFTVPKLVFTGEHFTGQVYELSLEKITVGRGAHNSLVLRHRSVSHTHCEFLVHGTEVIVRDLGSANGTFVNGIRVSEQSQVKSDQTVRFGSVQARLELDLPIGDDTASDLTAVYTLRRIIRDQKRDQKSPKPASACATFASNAYESSNLADQTVQMPAPSPIERKATPDGPRNSEVPAPKALVRKAILMGVSLALGIALSLWLILGKTVKWGGSGPTNKLPSGERRP